MTTQFDYDLFVIGGGSGGVRAARIAASEHGAKVAMAEEYRMGGTCVIRGCVPKKLMVFAAGHGAAMDEGAAYGWQGEKGRFDWPVFRARLHAELNRLEGIYTRNAESAGVTIYPMRATVTDPHTLRLADGRQVTAKHILIATGGTPFIPEPYRDLGAWTSNDIFLMDRMPANLLVLGGGFIACEMASLLQGLGVQVTQMYRGAQILRGFDRDVQDHVAAALVQQGIKLEVNTDLTALDRLEAGRFRTTDTQGRTRDFEAVLFATGRVANTAGLGLERAGVALDASGAVVVDAWSQTNVPSIYAVGDVTGRIQLTPVAIREGHAFADTVFGGRQVQVDHTNVASAVFTRPEAGTVGLTEDEARALGPVEIYMASFRPMQSAFINAETKALFKLVVCAETRRVLGCHIVAPGAGELIQIAAVAVKMGATKEDFDRTVAVHPTMSEELVLLRKPTR
ncbi:MAG: glutathione-disulfide reductase [Rhodobacter sp.]|uniref:glutathione-disulfide reductase n=1 Tax=Pararhodobacter sp. TaxID=2127056 RepID=UPI002CD96817|nr:glutathione-disulfide reductase [Pararhodobacter sp.]MCC0073481.1 glutathione-disulfide reductase [Rhodobacter sp.]HPD92129.1 glutathione-disulfide reductase [Pararhodobacter sp.]